MASHWSEWSPDARGREFTLGIEEEVMLLNAGDLSPAQEIDRVFETLPEGLRAHVTAETHMCALELATGVHGDVAAAVGELGQLRSSLAGRLEDMGLVAAAAGTHPFAVWSDILVGTGTRQQLVHDSMRELARREPTFALHVHVGLRTPERALLVANRLRAHLPLLLALSANSPFWQGRDTGLASMRTPLFQAFPRVGIPREFASYGEYVRTVDLLVRCQAIPEPTFLWWDIRLQPRFGTVEVRIMDVQSTVDASSALVALVQSVARLEAEEGFASDALRASPEVLAENRFLAARDGAEADLIDPVRERRIPVSTLLDELLRAAAPHARALGCEDELWAARELVDRPPAALQRSSAGEEGDARRVVRQAVGQFAEHGSRPRNAPAIGVY